MSAADVIVIGGGVVGSALAYGAMRTGAQVLLLDGDDADIRAARANFGLVWVQSKGLGFPPYQRWTVEARSSGRTSRQGSRSAPGRRCICASRAASSSASARTSSRRARGSIMRLHNQIVPPLYECHVIDRAELQACCRACGSARP